MGRSALACHGDKVNDVVGLSIIIPTHNRAGPLRACLDALGRQTVSPDDIEVIVVNDGSTDDTARLVSEMHAPFALRVLDQPRRGQTCARNNGARAARGLALLFLDDDIRASPTLVAAHLQAQAQGGSVGIGKLAQAQHSNDDPFVRHTLRHWEAHYHALGHGRTPTWRDCYSGNLSVPRDRFLELGGFANDLPMWFDLDLGYRLQQERVPVIYLADACGVHDDPKSAARLLAEMQNEGKVAPEFARRHPQTMGRLFDGYWGPTARAAWLRRTLLGLPVMAQQLAQVGKLLPGARRRESWYDLTEQFAYWRGVRSTVSPAEWARLTGRTPILMYHAIGAPGEPASRFVVPVGRLAKQLAWLRLAGYHPMSLQAYVQMLHSGVAPLAHAVIITFDDGYVDNFTLAYPLLRRYRIPATLFVVSDRIGGTNDWDRNTELRGRKLADWDALCEMRTNGIEIGAHTRTHADLTTCSDRELQVELDGSRTVLQERLGVPAQVLAYPFGKYDQMIQEYVQASGWLGGCTARHGFNTVSAERLALRRIEVAGTDSLARFVLKLARAS
jgi:peptidoglycan/xylan/chitin deacetylase (PgdA/CDA1 family)/GT2 family glycosyltransferase